MPRVGRQVPSVYFGRPGSLVTLPWPVDGIDSSYQKLTYDFVTGAGQHIVSSMLTGSRPLTVSWAALHIDTYQRLEPYWLGSNGPGPWAFIDPSRPNLFPLNVAAATGATADSTQFVTTGGSNGILSSNLDRTYIHRPEGYRSLRWLWSTAAATTPVLTTASGWRNWYGDPVVPGLSYAFSSWCRADGVIDTSITTQLQLRWLDSAGAQLSLSSGTSTAVTATWAQISVIAAAPAGAAYVQARWSVTGSTVTTGGSLYIDEPLLEQDSVVNTWAGGTGVRPVEIVELPEEVPFDARMRTGLKLSLRELAA